MSHFSALKCQTQRRMLVNSRCGYVTDLKCLKHLYFYVDSSLICVYSPDKTQTLALILPVSLGLSISLVLIVLIIAFHRSPH